MNDVVRGEFLRDLDECTHVEVSDWEAEFIESNLSRDEFTEKQRDVIDKMYDKYVRVL